MSERAKSKATSSQPALITPSASPSSPRPTDVPSHHDPDRPPPAKRPRHASTPLSAFSVSTASSSRIDPSDDIEEKKKASLQRLLNTWTQLAERYSRPLDEDDIIDLRDGSLFKDRGVLRNLSKTYEVGCFIEDEILQDAIDGSSDGGGALTEDEVDEIDAFAPEANISDELELEKEKLQVPPVRERDPADAEDLREFLEAEQQRREQFGDVEEDDGDEIRSRPVYRKNTHRDRSGSREDPEYIVRKNSDRARSKSVVEKRKDDRRDVKGNAVARESSPLTAVDGDSEDEFATWDFDQSTPARPAASSLHATPRIIDLTDSPPSSPPAPPVRRGRSKSVARAVSKPPPSPLAKSEPRATTEAPARHQCSMPPPSLPPIPALQLFTPPLSSSSVAEGSPDTVQVPDPELSSPSPSPPPRPPPRPRYRSSIPTTCATAAGISTVSGNAGTRTAHLSNDRTMSGSRALPKVAVTRRSKTAAPFRSTSSIQLPASVSRHYGGSSNPPSTHSFPETASPAKGKGKEISKPSTSYDVSQDGKDSATVRSISKIRKDNLLEEQREPQSLDVQSARTRKRKRIVSSPSWSEKSLECSPSVSPIISSRSVHDSEPGPSERVSSSNGRTRRAVPPSNSDHESDEHEHDVGQQRHASSCAPHAAPSGPFSFMFGPPFTPQQGERQSEYSPANDPQWQARMAQAFQYFTYFMSAAAGMPAGQGPSGEFPFPSPSTPFQWPPWTPASGHRQSHRRQHRGSRSPDAGPSDRSSVYATPAHSYSYSDPFTMGPNYSEGTLPPSSPPRDSSGPSSPLEPTSSASRYRSKSRGRKVSFKLDDESRPAPQDDGDSVDGAESRRSMTREIRDSSLESRYLTRSKEKSQGRNPTRQTDRRLAETQRKSEKARGKAKATVVSDGSESEYAKSPGGGMKKYERGRTPGPPSPQERSASVVGRRRKR
ncbi:uncharacterized protein LAESUDRAFT_720016 [Laetiporus sulphureus 93-53]|uniref:Uncharacterized protein n=1 Tax=Laetiporus sulphureus 93-53 TaxID=1314785 RepID=A0A165HQC7_9APHY|nr:uncharacterized protein LAESUDRAFT_720016 [Laetiporus sulphureus 93-53]KZT12046.1 hypothetical protein LAESUDRAFT_720016 [Laetiporus sulphureus 93-53]